MADFIHPELGLLGIIPIPSRAPFRESLSFFTDINPSYEGGEARDELRAAPRQRVQMDFTAQPAQSKDVFNTVYGGMARKWGIPLWQLARSVGNIAGGADELALDTRYADFRADSPVLLVGLCGAWAVRMVESVADEGLSLASGAIEMRGAYAVPLRIGRIVSSAEKTTSGYGADWKIGYEVDDNLVMTPDAPAQYYGEDIYLDPGLLEGDRLAEKVQTSLETFDFDLGLVNSFTPWLNNRTARTFRSITETDAEAWALRQWLYRRAGRARSFWQPSFENDARIVGTGSLISDTVTVRDDYRLPWAQNRVNLAFGMKDGTWLPRRVVDDTVLISGNHELLLDNALPLGTTAADIRCISYMGLKRLNSDTIDLDWLGNGRCEMAVQVVELSP